MPPLQPMEDLSFLANADPATATLVVLLPDGSVTHIAAVSPLRILDKCPLLYHALEFREHDARQANIEASSRYALVSLLRYIYTGDYLADFELSFLLNHVETFHIAANYDMPDLQLKAYVNLSRQTEFSCSLKEAPVTLCDAIRFIYAHPASFQSGRGQSLLDTLLNYCLAVFAYQALGNRSDFKQCVYDLPAFHRDLCRTSMQREFADEGASDLVKLPVSRPTPHSREEFDKRVLGDFQYELWKDFEGDMTALDHMPNGCPDQTYGAAATGQLMLAHRPKHPMASPSPNPNCTFTVAHRPKMFIDTSSSSGPSPSSPQTPDWVSVSPNEAKEEPQPDNADRSPAYGSEDEWTLL